MYIPTPGDINMYMYDNLLYNKAMVIVSTVRVCFRTFSTKTNLSTRALTCFLTQMLLNAVFCY